MGRVVYGVGVEFGGPLERGRTGVGLVDVGLPQQFARVIASFCVVPFFCCQSFLVFSILSRLAIHFAIFKSAKIKFCSRGAKVNWMSMRINSLFEHDASMKRQAEEAENQNMATSLFEGPIPEAQQEQDLVPSSTTQPKPNSGSGSAKSATRHRASIACASCRDRRIRVSV